MNIDCSKVITVILLLCISVTNIQAADMTKMEVSRKGKRFYLDSSLLLDVPINKIYAVLTDYNNMHHFSRGIKQSQEVTPAADGTRRVYSHLQGCVAFLCRSVEKVELLSTIENQRIQTLLLPELSKNVRWNKTEWDLSEVVVRQSENNAIEKTLTQVDYKMEFEPSFWVPPLLGTYMIKKSLAKDGLEIVERMEKYAQGKSEITLNSIPKKNRPYHIWLSEVMLQQTQVTTVIPYYQKFIASFPNLQTLSLATQDEVLAHWSGLGYYARGRNLHKAAVTMWQKYQAVPNNYELLLALPGIGQSTAGAIMAQAFDASYPILDGNVKRVLARYFGVEGWYGVSAVSKTLWAHSFSITPQKRVADYTQAIMDIGALVCKRSRPLCDECPLSKKCIALQTGRTSELPHSKPKKDKPIKQAHVLCVLEKQNIFLQQRPSKGIWGGLWSFPEFETVTQLDSYVANSFNYYNELLALDSFRHTFSHYHLDICHY